MDIELNYLERGSGPPLILLHGNAERLSYFKYQFDFFASHYRVIAIDTRGHGASPRGEAAFTLSQFADDLKCFLDRLGISKTRLLGFSDGGNIALLFALRFPDMVEALILNGANLNPWGVKLSVQLPVCMGYGLASVIALFDRHAAAKRDMLGLMVHQPNIRTSELAALDMPVLVIAGSRDMIRESHTRKIARSIPGAQLCMIEGDHFIARRKSDVFNRKVLKFLQGQ